MGERNASNPASKLFRLPSLCMQELGRQLEYVSNYIGELISQQETELEREEEEDQSWRQQLEETVGEETQDDECQGIESRMNSGLQTDVETINEGTGSGCLKRQMGSHSINTLTSSDEIFTQLGCSTLGTSLCAKSEGITPTSSVPQISSYRNNSTNTGSKKVSFNNVTEEWVQTATNAATQASGSEASLAVTQSSPSPSSGVSNAEDTINDNGCGILDSFNSFPQTVSKVSSSAIRPSSVFH